jgi:hypothetical protein
MHVYNKREEQFQLIPAIIEARRTALQHLQMDELAQMCFIQDSGVPQTVVESVSRADKKKLIDHIIEHMVHNHHPETEERYQFVEWLYRIRALMETIMDSSSQTSSGSSSEK